MRIFVHHCSVNLTSLFQPYILVAVSSRGPAEHAPHIHPRLYHTNTNRPHGLAVHMVRGQQEARKNGPILDPNETTTMTQQRLTVRRCRRLVSFRFLVVLVSFRFVFSSFDGLRRVSHLDEVD